MFASHLHLLLGFAFANPESDYARTLYEQERYVDAAKVYEQLWATERSSKYLFNAALAHQAAGELTQANLYFRIISGRSDIDTTERNDAAERAGLLRQVLTAVEIEIRPARALGPSAELRLQQDKRSLFVALKDLEIIEGPSQDPAAELPEDIDARPRTWLLYLEPGLWSVDVLPHSKREAFNTAGSVEAQLVEVPQTSLSSLTLSASFTVSPEVALLEIDIGSAAARRGVELHLRDPLGIRDYELTAKTQRTTLSLPTGPWRYELHLGKHPWLWRPRGPTLAGDFQVFSGATTEESFAQDLALELDDERRRQLFATVSGGTAIGFLVLGGGLLGGSQKASAEPWSSRDALALGSSGAFFLGSGAGLSGASLSAVLGAGRRSGLAQLALGGTAFATGAAWYALSYRSSISDADELQLYSSMALLGLGTGLGLGAAASLISRRVHAGRTQKTNIALRSNATGGGIHVSF